MKISEIYLKYIDCEGGFHYQSVSDLLTVGVLIDGETGNDMELADEFVYNKNYEAII